MNEPKPLQDEDLKFPVTCHFRIITEDIPGMNFIIETVLLGLGISNPVQNGNRSETGKYTSFYFSVEVESREMLNQIDSELRAIQGVKMVASAGVWR